MSNYKKDDLQNAIQGYSKYTNREGIPQQYKDYEIFVKTGKNQHIINCTIGSEATGATSNVAEIFPVCLSGGEKYIGKVIPYSVTPGGCKGIISEIEIQNKAHQGELAPEILMYFLGESNAVIIMNRIVGNTINSKLIDIIETVKKNQQEKNIDEAKTKILQIYKSVKKSLDNLHEKRIYHGDSHLENFMYESEDESQQESKQETKIWIIDFGHSSIDIDKKNVKILEDYMCLRSAFTILSKSKTREQGKFVLKGYSIYLEDIIIDLNKKILELEKCVCGPCVEVTQTVPVSMRRSKRKVSKRQSSRRKSKRQASRRQSSKRKVSERKVSNRSRR